MVMQGRREQNKQQCRARILKASRRLFSAKGFDQTTMEDVAAHAEVSKATLYNYFTSKDSLLMGIAEAVLVEIRQLVASMQDEPSALQKIRRVMQTFVSDSINYIALCRKITYLNSCEQSELYQTRLDMLAIFRELVCQAQAQGELCADVPADDIVDLLMGLYLTTQFQWPNISQYSRAECMDKLDRFLALTLAAVKPGDKIS